MATQHGEDALRGHPARFASSVKAAVPDPFGELPKVRRSVRHGQFHQKLSVALA
jgi:hypothetical protein